MKAYTLRVSLEREADGRWAASVPTLPGCATWGATRDEALANLHEEAQAFIEVMVSHNDPLPSAFTVVEIVSETDAVLAVAV